MVAGRPSSGSSSAPDLPLGFFAASQPHWQFRCAAVYLKATAIARFSAGRGGNKKSWAAGRPPRRSPPPAHMRAISRSFVSGRKISATTKLIAATTTGYDKPE